jgi:glycosyltransferase involved in cell wall biosynthesis
MACGLPVIANRQVGATELMPVEAQNEMAESPGIDDAVERLERMVADEAYRQTWKKYSQLATANNSIQISFEKAWSAYREAGL